MKLIIPGKPVAKKRPRFARQGNFVRTYNDQETEEGKFLLLARDQIPEPITGHPVEVAMVFHMPRPRSHFGTGKNQGKLKPSAPKHHTIKPDIDNLIKFPLDVLNGVAWTDDKQIITVTGCKVYSDKPRTEIMIHELQEDH